MGHPNFCKIQYIVSDEFLTTGYEVDSFYDTDHIEWKVRNYQEGLLSSIDKEHKNNELWINVSSEKLENLFNLIEKEAIPFSTKFEWF